MVGIAILSASCDNNLMKSSNISPFGEGVQKYWDKRYLYFSKFDEGIQIDKEGLYSVIPEETGLAQAALLEASSVYDAFAGVGGSAIALARSGKKVVSSEISSERVAMCRNNAEVYGVGRQIEFIEGDFFDVVKTVDAEAVNLDPPWGGTSYKEHGKFLLEHFSPDGGEILKACMGRFKEIMLRVPTIFEMAELDRFTQDYQVHDDVSDGRTISRTVVIRQF